MKDQARIVIVGGGIFGTSIAYHLARAGCTDVVLVEKGELTSGTTFHSVGLVSQFRTSPALMKIMNYTINLYSELAKGEAGDITPEDSPLEAGLGMFVCWSKPDFIGKEALEKIQKQGLSSRLVALTMDAGGNLYGGESVFANGRVIDRIRSGSYGYSIGRDIGLVYLPPALAKVGTELEVQVMGERVKAKVANLPLVDPKGQKLKA